MGWIIFALVLALAGCSDSPTAPSPIVQPPPAAQQPAAPVAVAPPPNPLLTDPRFDRNFYRMFALNGYDSPHALMRLKRQTQAPRIYLRTVHSDGRAIDAFTLDQTAAALIDVAGKLTGVFGLAGLERGAESRRGLQGWITVSWEDDPERRYCGRGGVGQDWLVLYTNTAGCRCSGGPQINPLIVKHELGHVLGFYHTDHVTDLMYAHGHRACDMQPSEREVYHARVAYSLPVGSGEP